MNGCKFLYTYMPNSTCGDINNLAFYINYMRGFIEVSEQTDDPRQLCLSHKL